MKHPSAPPYSKLVAFAVAGIVVVAIAWLIDSLVAGFIAFRPASLTQAPEVARAEIVAGADGGNPLTFHDHPRVVPEIRFLDGEGKARSIADFRGKAVLLNIWATWCGPCRREMPTLDRLQAGLGGTDFQVVALSIDHAGSPVVRSFYAEVGVRHLGIYVDNSGDAMRRLGAVGLPMTLLIDRQGREVARLVGSAEWDAPEMVVLVRRFLAKQAKALLPWAARQSRRVAGRSPSVIDLTVAGYATANFTTKDPYHDHNQIT